MNLTQEEKDLFDSLSKAQSGRILLSYFKRLEGWIYDSRNWEKDENKDSANLAARAIRQCLIEKIGPKSGPQVKIGSEFE